MKKILSLFILLTVWNFSYASSKPTLIIYCGITMVKPIKEIATIIEKKHNCTIRISQGGSKDLYDSLKRSKVGDLYIPGSESYRLKNIKDGYLLDSVYIGYNQAAIFVQKGNPKNIQDLDDLVDYENAITICNPKSGSIGRMTKKLLINYKNKNFFYDVFDATVEIGTDSRNLNRALIEKRVDATINWRATGFWPENSKHIDIIPIDEKYAPKKRLLINLLSFSKHREIAKYFMDYATSKQGQDIMKKYGFL